MPTLQQVEVPAEKSSDDNEKENDNEESNSGDFFKTQNELDKVNDDGTNSSDDESEKKLKATTTMVKTLMLQKPVTMWLIFQRSETKKMQSCL